MAMQGRVGEYLDETPEQLKVQYGAGITGWVAEHREAAAPRRRRDRRRAPRRSPAPRTTSTSRCSSRRCSSRTRSSASSCSPSSGCASSAQDDLRLLEIYASFAAQAMANADATERLREQSAALEQKVRGQRELLQITESILTTLDPPGPARHDRRPARGARSARTTSRSSWSTRQPGVLAPVVARGVDAEYYLEPWHAGRDRPRDVGPRAQRAGPRRRRVRRRARPAAAERPDPRQPRRASRCAAATARSAC